jgi:hypothetical protein
MGEGVGHHTANPTKQIVEGAAQTDEQTLSHGVGPCYADGAASDAWNATTRH